MRRSTSGLEGDATSSAWRILAPSALLCLPGCGAGVVAVVASSGGSGGGTTPALALGIENPKVSPCRLRLEASQAVRVELFYDAGGSERAMSRLRDLAGNVVDLPASPVELVWDFAGETGLAASFTDGVRLVAKSGGAPISGAELTLGLGNDAPAIAAEDPAPEVDGVVPIRLALSDSSGDVVSIRAEFQLAGEPADLWHPARPAGLRPGDPTPDPALVGQEAPAGGRELSFFWDTDVDLADLERDARLRFTPDDLTLDAELNPVGIGASALTGLFRVDNNAAPVVQLDSGPLILNPDERRGIPVPFKVFDEEGDLVEVVFQWRRPGEDFPDLPGDPAALDAILADPVERAAHHVCTPYPRFARGRALPVDSTTIRLPELALGESWVLHAGLAGRTLELLRPSAIPAPLTPSWSSNPLAGPVAALPLGDGLTALVLDVPGAGRLREIELATGAVVREIASLGPGLPSTMALERGERAALVALDDAGTWRIERVELASGAITELALSDGSEPAPVRGIASLGTKALVFTAGAALFHLDYRDPPGARLGRLLANLAEPWGVVVDPLPPHRIYLAERAADRVLALDLDSHGGMPVTVRTSDLQPSELVRPSALALERRGSRLLAVTEPVPGSLQLVGLELGADGRNALYAIGPVHAGTSASLASGEEELRLLVVHRTAELFAGGGLEQRREIAVAPAYDPSTQRVAVTTPFEPAPRPGQPWRIGALPLLPASPEGFATTFVWSTSTDLPGGGSAFLRAQARDAEAGAAVEGAAEKPLRAAFDALALDPTPAFDEPQSVAAADLDGDGDFEILSANRNFDRVTVFFQDSPGTFRIPALALDPTATFDEPQSVAAADLDGDGDFEILSANDGGLTDGSVTVFFQESPGAFRAPALKLDPTPHPEDGPVSVAAADLDGDGDLEILAACISSDRVTVFFQDSPGAFRVPALALADPFLEAPVSVAAADLDGDGDLELLAANQGSDRLTVFFQEPPGTFRTPALALDSSPARDRPQSVAAADLDGDGDLEILSANAGDFFTLNADSVTVFFQESPGTFLFPPLALDSTPAFDGPQSVAAADLDGDGDLEILAANGSSHLVTAFFQESPGAFRAPALLNPTADPFDGPSSVAAADLDGDGNLEILAANAGSDRVAVFFRDSPGAFSAPPLALDSTPPFDRPQSVAAADLDGDGNLEILAANAGSDRVTVFFQDSPGAFRAPALALDPTPAPDQPRSVAAADLDGDGDLEILAANFASDRMTVFFQDFPRAFRAPALALADLLLDGPNSVGAADLDGDGDLELLAANGSSNCVTVFFQDFPGAFRAPALALADLLLDGPNSVGATDLDGDGDLELLAASASSDRVTVFFQDSPGAFRAPALALDPTPVSDGPSSVAAADLDGDGDLEILAACDSSDRVTVFFQDSPGAFRVPALALDPTPASDGPTSVAAADLDGDGDLEILAANFISDCVTVFFQDSPGAFRAPALALAGPSLDFANSVAAADLDGDGDLEILAASQNSDRLTVFWGGR